MRHLGWRMRGLTGRCSEPRPASMRGFRVVSSSSLEPSALSGAVADLVSCSLSKHYVTVFVIAIRGRSFPASSFFSAQNVDKNSFRGFD